MAAGQSLGHSSPEEYDDDPTVEQEGQWPSHEQHNIDQNTSVVDSNTVSSSPNPRVPPPMQKRRRVTRACDECRRKKIKCDGKQPCTHCTVYSYDCTYDQPSNRRRNPAPQYIEAIESRLHRAEALLKVVLPDVDLNDPNLDIGVLQQMHASTKLGPHNNVHPGPEVPPTKQATGGDTEKDSLLESMVENTGALDLDDRGNWDFRGHSSGFVFLQRMREQFGDLMGEAQGQGGVFLKTRPMAQVFDSPKSSGDSPMDSNLPNTHDLPSKAYARELCENTLDEACALMRFVHQPTFYAAFDRIYDTPSEHYGNEENRFLPLLYVVLAVGCLFAKSEHSKLEREGYENAIDQGFKFFKASRQMMDITDCRDLPSLQAVIFMIMFMQCSAKLATCYSYIGIALRSAIRMGLHRSVSTNFNPVERETRKRMFWTIRKMDIYVGAVLGLPTMLSNDDIDQECPQEVDDEFITVDQILPMPPGKVPCIAATNAHTRLLKVLQKVVKYIYPIKGLEQASNQSNQSYVVSHARIREIERDLQAWMEALPMALKPGGEVPTELARVQQLLRMAYAHVQMILYRPFLHYVSAQTGSIDKRSYACAAACVSVSRNIIHITAEMKKRGLLAGAYWFTMYTTFFAILSLVYFALENPDSPTSQEILKDANEGKDALASLSKRSMAADRCTVTLTGLFGQLTEKLQHGRSISRSKKKRNAPSPNPVINGPTIHSASYTPKQNSYTEHGGNIQRASTYPGKVGPLLWKSASLPHDAPDMQHSRIAAIETDYHVGPPELYTPTNSESMGIQTPESGSSGGMPFNTVQASFGLQQNCGDTGVPALSAMMFPSSDPFAYPNQPMTTLENRQFTKQENLFNPLDTKPLYNTASPSNSNPYDNIEVQLFGPLPPYLMQTPQPGMGMQNMGAPLDVSGAAGEEGMMAMNGGASNAWIQSQGRAGGVAGMNLDEMFGDEWKGGWTEQGFRQ